MINLGRCYDEYCHTCNTCKARTDSLSYNRSLYQCLNCGSCWIETRTIKSLKTIGKDEKAWNDSKKEAYIVIEECLEPSGR